MMRLLGGAALALVLAGPAAAQIAVSANDHKAVLDNGVIRIVRNPPADTITILDLAGGRVRVMGELAVPNSVVGPPLSVAITPDERFAIVTSAQKVDPADPSRTIPDNRVSLVALGDAPRVVQTVEAGAGPSGVSVNRAGTLVLVANRNAGTVSVFRLREGQLAPLATVTVGPPASGVSHVQFTPDGRRALVTRDGDSMISMLTVDGETVAKGEYDITVGIRPYGLAITPDGRWAVAANIGRSSGDADTVSLIDLAREPYRTVDTVTVGPTPEGIQVSPDGRYAAVTVMNGSNRPSGHPLRGTGMVRLLRIEDGRLRLVGEAPVGNWAQGVVFSRDGRLLVQNMVDRNLAVFRMEGDRLVDTGERVAVNGGPSGFRTAETAP